MGSAGSGLRHRSELSIQTGTTGLSSQAGGRGTGGVTRSRTHVVAAQKVFLTGASYTVGGASVSYMYCFTLVPPPLQALESTGTVCVNSRCV